MTCIHFLAHTDFLYTLAATLAVFFTKRYGRRPMVRGSGTTREPTGTEIRLEPVSLLRTGHVREHAGRSIAMIAGND
jgi:hypothetical protein